MPELLAQRLDFSCTLIACGTFRSQKSSQSAAFELQAISLVLLRGHEMLQLLHLGPCIAHLKIRLGVCLLQRCKLRVCSISFTGFVLELCIRCCLPASLKLEQCLH